MGAVAVIPVFGIVAHRMNLMTAMSGGTSTGQLGATIKQAVDAPNVSAVVLDIDSPGGSVFGVQELGDAIYSARGRKPIVASVNATCASAAYWIASQADEIVVTPSGQVGSIGVIAVHEDRSKQAEMLGVRSTFVTAGKFKAAGNDLAPLDDATMADLQHRVDQYYDAFVGAVARGRGVSVAAVVNGFGEGRMVSAPDAVTLGMVDGLGTLDAVIRRLANGSRSAIESVSVINRAETQKENTTMSDQRSSPRGPLRRAQLDQHGNAITWTDTGVIINGLEIIHEPSRDEASREIGVRQRAHMYAGVEAREALARALAEVHPVYRHAYLR